MLKLFFRSHLRPFRKLWDTVFSLSPLRNEIVFFAASFIFAVVFVLVSGFRQQTINYYRFLHRGLHEDVMIIGDGDEKFAAHMKKFLMNKKTKLLDLGVESYALYRLIDSHLVIDDNSKKKGSPLAMTGEFDAWIKACPDGKVGGNASFYIPPGSLAMSRAMSRQLFHQDLADMPKKTKVTLRQLGRSKKSEFTVDRVIDLGGKYNVIFLPLSSLSKLSFPFKYTFPDHLGINTSQDVTPLALKEELQNEFTEYQVVTSDELEYIDTARVKMYLQFAPIFLFSLFIANLVIMYIFIVLDNFRLRKRELQLMDLYLYSRVKKSMLFSFLNIVPIAAGFMLAVPFSMYMLKNFSAQSWMHGVGGTVNMQMYSVPFLITVLMELALIISIALMGSVAYAWRKVAID